MNEEIRLGEIITREREKRGVSIADLARGVGVSWQQIQKYEAGDTIKADRLLLICRTLKAPLSAFLGDEVRQLEHEAGLSEKERAWVEQLRKLEAAEADRLVGLDERGRRLVRLYLAMEEGPRRRLFGEALRIGAEEGIEV